MRNRGSFLSVRLNRRAQGIRCPRTTAESLEPRRLLAVPVSNSGGPYFVDEGATLVVHGTSTSAIAAWEWDFDYSPAGGFQIDATGKDALLDATLLDGPLTRTIALRVTDGSGQTAIDTGTVNVENVAPLASTRIGPAVVAEGDTGITFGLGGAWDPNPDDLANLRYHFDTNGDGQFDVVNSASNQTTIPASVIADGPLALTLRARVTDNDGDSSTYTFPLTVQNAEPFPTLTAPSYARVGAPYTVSFSLRADPGLDTIQLIRVQWGDGTSTVVPPGIFQATKTYTAPEQLYLSVSVTDEDGTYTRSTLVHVQSLPRFTGLRFQPDAPAVPLFVPFPALGPRIHADFDAHVGTDVSLSSLVLMDLTRQQIVPTSQGSAGLVVSGPLYNWSIQWRWPAGLPDGEYRATMPAGAVLGADGLPTTTATSVDFYIVAGDVNRDRTVNFDDLLLVAQNFGKSWQTFSQGNINYSTDGLVDFDDLLILAQRYGTSLVSALPANRQARRRMDAAMVLD